MPTRRAKAWAGSCPWRLPIRLRGPVQIDETFAGGLEGAGAVGDTVLIRSQLGVGTLLSVGDKDRVPPEPAFPAGRARDLALDLAFEGSHLPARPRHRD